MYKAIANHPRVRQIYAEKLSEQKVVTPEAVGAALEAYNHKIEEALAESKKTKISPRCTLRRPLAEPAQADREGLF